MKITQSLKMTLKALLSLRLGQVETDKGELFWDGEGDLMEGMEVFVQVHPESGDYIPAPDGEYTIQDGKVVVVVEGKVAELRDPEAEVAPEEEPVQETSIQEESNEEVQPADEPEQPESADEEDRIAALEARLAEFTDGLNQIVNSLAALEERLTEVESKLANVEKPAADPIADEPSVQESFQKSILSYLRK